MHSDAPSEEPGFRAADPFWDALIADTGDAVFVLDAGLLVRAANLHAARLMGLSRADLLGRSFRELLLGKDLAQGAALIERAILSGRPVTFRFIDRGLTRRATCRPFAAPDLLGGHGVILACTSPIGPVLSPDSPSRAVIEERAEELDPRP